MKSILFFCFLLLTEISFCQEKINPSDAFVIEGNIKRSITFSVHTADSLPSKALGDIASVNHLGEVKSIRKNVKGILLRDILNRAELNARKPKELYSYYFILTGTDGYKVVLSYSQVFDGSNIYVVTESNGKSWQQIEDRIAILILTEPHKGHIAMKGLSRLMVEKVN